MTDEFFMQQALKEARKAFDKDEVPVGAVIVINDKIIARGYNQVETLTDPTAHAEMIALTSAFNYLGSKYLPDASVYITIEPCLMCAGALFWSKVGKIIYGADDEKNGYKKYLPSASMANGSREVPWPFHPKTALVQGVLKDECCELMKEFFNAKR